MRCSCSAEVSGIDYCQDDLEVSLPPLHTASFPNQDPALVSNALGSWCQTPSQGADRGVKQLLYQCRLNTERILSSDHRSRVPGERLKVQVVVIVSCHLGRRPCCPRSRVASSKCSVAFSDHEVQARKSSRHLNKCGRFPTVVPQHLHRDKTAFSFCLKLY